MKKSRSGPQISHMLLADDCVLFGEAIVKGAQVLKTILKEYEINLGQCISFDKSTVFF